MRLEIKNLCKTYKKGVVKALDDFSVTLTPGVYGLLGPNGAGKSTLMNIITDNLNADSGEVLYDGEEIKKLGKDYRTVLGYMPQQQGLYDDFTLNRFLWYMAALKGLKKKEAKQKIASLLETVNLKESAHKKLGSFSGGMKQRVAIARALANQPEVLLMDEPFGALDPHTKSMMQLLMREIWEQDHPTVVFITHDIDEAVFLANKIYVMSARPGKVVKEVNVYLTHKRGLELKDTPEFIKLRKDINELLYAHSNDE